MAEPVSTRAAQVSSLPSYSSSRVKPPKKLYVIFKVPENFPLYYNYCNSNFYTSEQLKSYHQQATENYLRIEVDTTKITTIWKRIKNKDGTEFFSYTFASSHRKGYVKSKSIIRVEKPLTSTSEKKEFTAPKGEINRETMIFENSLGIAPKQDTPPIRFDKPIFLPNKKAIDTGEDMIDLGNGIFCSPQSVIKFGKTDS
jgi:hypothetical protein